MNTTRIISVLLTAAMLLILLPNIAVAATESHGLIFEAAAATLYIDSNNNGTADTDEDTTMPQGFEWNSGTAMLTLTNFVWETTADNALIINGDANLLLLGTNTLQSTATAPTSACTSGLLVNGKLTIIGNGTLGADGGNGGQTKPSYGIKAASAEINGGIVVANGGGAVGGDSVGIMADDNLVFNDGIISVTGGASNALSCGISGKNITVAGGTINITAGRTVNSSSFGIRAERESQSGGAVTITGGTVIAQGGDCSGSGFNSYGIHAYEFTIGGGTINATGGNSEGDSYGAAVDADFKLTAGQFTVKSGEGKNCTGLSVGNATTVSGGVLISEGGKADNQGCGLYSGSDITITGGKVTAIGGESGGDSYGLKGGGMIEVNGGELKAIGGTAVSYSYGVYADGSSAAFDFVSGTGSFGGDSRAIFCTTPASVSINAKSYAYKTTSAGKEEPRDNDFYWKEYRVDDEGAITGTQYAIANSGDKFIKLTTVPFTVISDVTVSGTVNSALATHTATLTSYLPKSNSSVDEPDASDWFKADPLPSGLTVSAYGEVTNSTIWLTFGGTPTVESSVLIDVTIPLARHVLPNPEAKFDIRHTYGMTAAISVVADLDFGTLTTPYSPPPERTVTITNTGSGDIALTQPTAANFIIGTLSDANGVALTPPVTIAAGETAIFTVQPLPGLAAGSYSNDITVSGTGIGIFSTPAVSCGPVTASFTVDTPPPSPPPAPRTVNLGGVNVPYSIDKDGVVSVAPSEDMVKQIIENADGGPVVLDFSGIAGITGIVFKIDPAWFDGAGDMMILMKNGYSLTIQDGMMGELVNHYGGFVEFIVQMGSVTVSVKQDSQEIPWYSFEFPMTVAMPFASGNDYTVMRDKPDGSVTGRSWYDSGTAYAKVYRAGTYDAETVTPTAFADTSGRWMEEAVMYVSARDVVKGIGGGLFAPDREILRAEFLVMLMSALNPEPQGEWMVRQFADVPEGAYYYNAALMARAIGVVQGVGDDTFNPDAQITRQDMFTMLYRAMDLMNMTPDVYTGQFIEFSDWDEVADYAAGSIQNLAKLGLVQGTGGGVLDPRGNATRGEAAQLVYNMLLRDVASAE